MPEYGGTEMIQTIQNVICYLFPIIGVVCILLPGYVTAVLPYLLGGAMVLAGMVRGVNDIRNKAFLSRSSNGLAYGLILLIMGTAFIMQGGKLSRPHGYHLGNPRYPQSIQIPGTSHPADPYERAFYRPYHGVFAADHAGADPAL